MKNKAKLAHSNVRKYNGHKSSRLEAGLKSDYSLLSKIDSPAALRQLPVKELPALCQDIRDYLIETLSTVGGHFASNLGVIELTVALHYAYETPEDRLIWDVGHQIYPHKILTGRREELKSVRCSGGLSGFPKREESVFDLYNTGHAGTSISQLLGEAVARDMQGKSHKCVCVIGDASIASGMALEALNHGGHINSDCLVVLNDNDMSISHNVGALNQYLNRLISSPLYMKWKRLWYTLVMWLPLIGPALRTFSRRMEHSFIDLFTPGGFFANLGFRYIGPVDGHDVIGLVKVLRKLKKSQEAMLLHVYTQKGQGYTPAQKNPIRYHSVSLFNPLDGSFTNKVASNTVSYSQIVGESLLELARKNPKVVAVTPAMIEGSGLRPLYNAMPERVFDVGIAEQHSLSFAGALASAGMIPYLCIYSTFLNRGIDQLIQDVALMNFPVRMIVDRAGCVGPDGETHQGLYDLGLLLSIPNIQVYAPATANELKAMIYYMENHNTSPLALRFPKGSCSRDKLSEDLSSELKALSFHRPVIKDLDQSSQIEPKDKKGDLGILSIGTMWDTGLTLQRQLQEDLGIKARNIGLRWIRPLDLASLQEALYSVEHFIIIEDSYLHSSAAAYILQIIEAGLAARHLHTFAFPPSPIEHGDRKDILEVYGISAPAILRFLKDHPLYQRKKSPSKLKTSEFI